MPVRNEPYGAIRAVLRDLQERADITPVHHRLRDLEAPGGSLPGRGGGFSATRHEWRTGARIWPKGSTNIQIKIRGAGAAGNQCADLNHIVKRGRERGKVRMVIPAGNSGRITIRASRRNILSRRGYHTEPHLVVSWVKCRVGN